VAAGLLPDTIIHSRAASSVENASDPGPPLPSGRFHPARLRPMALRRHRDPPVGTHRVELHARRGAGVAMNAVALARTGAGNGAPHRADKETQRPERDGRAGAFVRKRAASI
jgi:hypothetical protein